MIEKCCDAYRVNNRILKEAVFAADIIEESYIHSAAQILHAVASYLILERMATLKEDLMAVRLDAYLSAHYTEKLNARMISEYLGIGKTRLYEIAKESYGCGIAEHIRKERIEKAKALLLSDPALPVSEIAVLSGFSDYNNFITLFRKQTGFTPRQFRAL